ncbi:hypothetical protein D0962_04705 [Leptolyngbyaceae cyanobacterium CCMR0082]|uniref:Uncharacterized protein n=1 Tax=Adonisia turfae CCMR0082 TaxID=2304604 RepID=A0A6M0S1H0_9CYAN|nr:hypothetical protein [Adonisia turfae]NEZ62080.1 hypothetical protein [Adonisia turfae CCMR0082]
MKQQLQQRLQQLKAELESGQKVLADLEVKQNNVRETLLRISGAIQVIEEELAKADETQPNDSATDNNGHPLSSTNLDTAIPSIAETP